MSRSFTELAQGLHPYMLDTLVERFTSHVPDRPDNGCWLWDGRHDRNGYGQFYLLRSVVQAHRLSYWLATGEEPGDHYVCHRCDNPACVRPDHLFLATQRENIYDAMAKGRIDHRAMAAARWPQRSLAPLTRS